MLGLVSLPAGIVTASVPVQGPLALVEKTPCGELELTVTAIAAGVFLALPASRVPSTIGPEAPPALSSCAGLSKVRPSWPQYEKVFHPSLNQAPPISLRHQRFCPGGPHAPTPGSAASSGCPES